MKDMDQKDGHAFLNDITTYPDGTVHDHRQCIVDEMMNHGVQTRQMTPSQTLPTFQKETTTKLSIRTMQLMDKIRKILPSLPGATNEAKDMELVRKYVEGTAPRASEGCRSGLFRTCERILDGTEPRGLKPKVVKVLHWQYDQMEVIDKLLKSLVFERHLVEYHHAQDAVQFMNDLGDDSLAAFRHIDHRLSQIPEFHLLIMSQDPTYRILFLDGHDLLLNNLVLNRLRHEKDFRLEPIAIATEIFLKREFVLVVLECFGTFMKVN